MGDAIQCERLQTLEDQAEAYSEALERLAQKKLKDIQKGDPIILSGEEYTLAQIIDEQFDNVFLAQIHAAYIEICQNRQIENLLPQQKRLFRIVEDFALNACRTSAEEETGFYK